MAEETVSKNFIEQEIGEKTPKNHKQLMLEKRL